MNCSISVALCVFLTAAAAPACAAGQKPTQRKVVWDLESLKQPPKVHETTESPAPGMRAFFYEGAEYKGKPTRVFAYYAAPEGTPPQGGWPAVVCAHGGGGTAYPDWIRKWNEHGYAAISMDLEGHLPTDPRTGYDGAGPSRIDWFGDRNLPDDEQWFYHAVADVIRANSLLRSFPEINPEKIGLTGISWGGTIVTAVAGVDPRFAFVIPVYGCGFLYESDNKGITQWFAPAHMTAAQLEAYKTKYDPAAHLPHAKMPMLWMNGTNDGTFPMDIFQRSALSTAGPRTLCIRIRWIHGHDPGWRQKEIFAFADSITRGTPPLHRFEKPEYDPATRIARCKVTGSKLASASLNFTTGDGEWKTRWWDNAGAEIQGDQLVGKLPADAKFFFFNARDEQGLLGSSVYVKVEAP